MPTAKVVSAAGASTLIFCVVIGLAFEVVVLVPIDIGITASADEDDCQDEDDKHHDCRAFIVCNFDLN